MESHVQKLRHLGYNRGCAEPCNRAYPEPV